MPGTKIKFTWGTPPIEGARWLLGYVACKPAASGGGATEKRSRRENTRRTFYVSVRTFLLTLLGLAVAGYFGAAYVLYHVQSKNPYNRVAYADLALPWRWPGLDAKRGAALIEQARAELKAGQFAAGASRLRMGLERNPTDAEARHDLAYIYTLRRVRAHADRLLIEAFDHGYPGSDYIKKAHALISGGDVPDKELRFLNAARAALDTFAGPAADARTIDTLMIDTLLRLDRHDEAAQTGRRIHPENSPARFRLEITVALAAGDPAGAADWADRWRALNPDSTEMLTRAADVYRQAGRLADMQACIDRLRKLAPVRPAHVSLNIVQNLRAGRPEAARTALEDGLFRFGSDARVLATWARDIAETGDDDMLVRLEEFMREQGQSVNPARFARLMALIRSRDWVTAREVVARVREREDLLPPVDRPRLDVVTGLVMACADAGGGYQQVFLAAYQRNPFGLEFTREMIEALLAADRAETAGRLVTLALGPYPESRSLNEAAQRIDERLAALAKQREAERPAGETSPAANFADAKAFFDELNRPDRSGGAEAGLSLIRAVRKQSPDWLAGNEEALARIEVELAAGSDDITRLQLTARTYLRSHPQTSREHLLKLAAGWHEQGRKTEALLVLREILKMDAGFKPALQALEAWEPKPESAVQEMP